MNISRPHVSPRAAAAPLTSLSPTANSTSTITAYSEEQLEVLATPRTRLNDLPGDYSTDAIIDHVLRLRDAGAAGLEIPAVCMAGYQKTTLQNDAQLYIDREYFLDGVFPAIRDAKDSIHIAMLSFDGGRVGQYTADLLIEKKKQNPDLEVRVILDSLGSLAFFPWSATQKNVRKMRAAGIEVVVNNFFKEGMEHRKSVIIDSQKAFISGTCLSDQYFANESYWDAFDKAVKEQGLEAARQGAFLPASERLNSFDITPDMAIPEFADFGVSFEGKTVNNLQASFLQSWCKHGQPLDPELSNQEIENKYFPPLPPSGSMPIKMNHGIPWGPGEMQQTILSVIEGAQDTLDIEMAYLHIPEFSAALAKAAKRGVDIRMITNSQDGIDIEFSWHVNRQFYPELLEAGVRIFELDHYSHRKFIVADKRVVFTSTGNPEWNSWERGWDEIALIDSPAFAKEIEDRVLARGRSPEHGHEVSLEELAQESLWTRIKSAIFVFLFNSIARLYRWLVNPHLATERRRQYVSRSKNPLLKVVRSSSFTAISATSPGVSLSPHPSPAA